MIYRYCVTIRHCPVGVEAIYVILVYLSHKLKNITRYSDFGYDGALERSLHAPDGPLKVDSSALNLLSTFVLIGESYNLQIIICVYTFLIPPRMTSGARAFPGPTARFC